MSSQHPLQRAVQPVVEAVGARLVDTAEAEPFDVPLVWEGQTVGAVRMPPLHGALDRLIDSVEAELGSSLPSLSRVDKQRAVRLLDLSGPQPGGPKERRFARGPARGPGDHDRWYGLRSA